VSPAAVDTQALQPLANQALGVSGAVQETPEGDRLRLASGSNRIEVYRGSGGVWRAGRSQLWSPELAPTLPEAQAARQIAALFLRKGVAYLRAEDL